MLCAILDCQDDEEGMDEEDKQILNKRKQMLLCLLHSSVVPKLTISPMSLQCSYNLNSKSPCIFTKETFATST